MSHEVIMPALGMVQDSGLILAWRKAPGDPVAASDILLEVETDKAAMEIEAGFDGFVADIRVAEGVDVPVGAVIAVLTRERPEAPRGPAEPTAPEASAAAPPPDATPTPDGPRSVPDGRVRASPKARRLARERGIDLQDIHRAGDPKPLHATDLQDGQADRGLTGDARLWDMDHSVFGPVTAEKMPRFRRTATVGLTAAHRTIPAVTHHDRADISALETRRAALQAAGGPPLTALAFHVATLARSLQAHPRFNASLSPDGGTLWLKGYVSVGIAVETPHGLAVPVIREIPDKGLRQIADEIADLAERARSRRLQPGDTGGAGMTISNLGSLGGLGFTPIINPPEVAILGISRAGMTPVWNGESFEAQMTVPLSLTYDHRVINGVEAARFLADYIRWLAEPPETLS